MWPLNRRAQGTDGQVANAVVRGGRSLISAAFSSRGRRARLATVLSTHPLSDTLGYLFWRSEIESIRFTPTLRIVQQYGLLFVDAPHQRLPQFRHRLEHEGMKQMT